MATAQNPASILNQKADFSVSDEEREALRAVRIAAIETGPTDSGIHEEPETTSLLGNGELSGEAFGRLWGVDIWKALGAGAVLLGKPNGRLMETPPEVEPIAMQAMVTIEKAVDTYPQWFGWMKSGFAQDAVDLQAVAIFAGIKVMAIKAALSPTPIQEGEET